MDFLTSDFNSIMYFVRGIILIRHFLLYAFLVWANSKTNYTGWSIKGSSPPQSTGTIQMYTINGVRYSKNKGW